MNDNKNIGNMGEKMACDFIRKNGYTIIGNNYRKKVGEIDIIAKKNEVVHFIEVKTRSVSSLETFGLPQDAVSGSKQKKIMKTALYYLQQKKLPENTSWQIDVIAITIDWRIKKAKVCFIENAVENTS